MKEICLPLEGIPDNNTAEVIVRSPALELSWHYRIESFDFNMTESMEKRITNLQEQIQKYDPRWELIQIIDTNEDESCVHVLYRKKKSID